MAITIITCFFYLHHQRNMVKGFMKVNSKKKEPAVMGKNQTQVFKIWTGLMPYSIKAKTQLKKIQEKEKFM